MKSLILILLWASSMFFFTSYARARDSDAAVQVGKEPLALEPNAILSFESANRSPGEPRRCIGVDRASTSSGAYIKQFTCDGSENQKWLLTYGAELRYRLQNNKSHKCMGVDRASTNPGANMV